MPHYGQERDLRCLWSLPCSLCTSMCSILSLPTLLDFDANHTPFSIWTPAGLEGLRIDDKAPLVKCLVIQGGSINTCECFIHPIIAAKASSDLQPCLGVQGEGML